MKTTTQISLGFIFGLLCFIGGYQYFNHTESLTKNGKEAFTKNTSKELFECPDGVYFELGLEKPSEAYYVGVTCDNGVNKNSKSRYLIFNEN